MSNIKNKYLIGAAVILIAVPLVLAMVRPSSRFNLLPTNVTPTPFEGNSSSPVKGLLGVVSTNPQDKSINIPLNTKITITFNENVTPQGIKLTTIPEISGTVEIVKNRYILTPASSLPPSTNYLIVIGFSFKGPTPQGVHNFSFTTFGPTPTQLPNTRPVELIEQTESYQKQNSPDLYLKNQTPYSNSSFSITSAYTKTPSGHFYFIVTLKGANKDASRSSFENWVKSKGLSDSQIQSLDIRYK